MSLLEALLLSLFQGISEFLPISSSGHLLLFQTLFGNQSTPPSLLFTTFLHLGTMCAILVGLRAIIFNLTLRDLLQIVLGLVPLIPLVFFLKQLKPLLSNPHLLPLCFALGGLFLLSGEWATTHRKGKEAPINVWIAPLLIGIGQAVSVLPGISRLGTTVAVALWLGWNREKALIFSLLLSIPTVAGALLEEVLSHALSSGPAGNAPLLPFATALLCFLVTFGSGLLALHLIRRIARSASFKGFGFYCLALGAALFFLSLFIKL